MIDIISKKRDGGKLSKAEIEFVISGYTSGQIPDYQMSALLMAVYIRKMDGEETYNLTVAMKESGDIVDLSDISGIKVDKHSTGGVGDKTTLVAAPLAAACGVPIAKMSGRGLGFTGGTVDKMESIPGFQTSLESGAFKNLVKNVGMSIIGQTEHVAPADKKIYALRDVTGTVSNLSLITSSIMSKKLASGSDAVVLDVKCGNGAFMETITEATELGEKMVEIGSAAGKKTVAVITDMNQPLGRAVGNSIEVIEAIETLKGKGPSDITELSLALGGIMIFVGEKASSIEEGRAMAEEALKSGAALDRFIRFIDGQGGDIDVISDYSLFPQHKYSLDVTSKENGFVCGIKAMNIGLASQHAGAGRAKKDDVIDLSAGIYLHKKVNDGVEKGDILATLYGNDQDKLKCAAEEVIKAYSFSTVKGKDEVMIKKIIGI